MPSAVIVDAVRTAAGRGKPGGALSRVHPSDLLATVLRALVERSDLDPATVDDVIAGCVGQAGEQARNIGRHAVLAAGFPESVPATTIDRQCGSNQQAAHFAAQGVMSGAYDIAIACGVKPMSRVPMGTSTGGADAQGSGVRARYPDGLVNQGISAELVGERWKLDRENLDAYSARSHTLAAAAADAGLFDREVVPVQVEGGEHRRDETVRAGTTQEGLAALRPSFRTDAATARFPERSWSITPGNSSPLTDRASAVLIMSEERASRLGLTPLARFVAFSVVGDDPLMMLTGPIPATRKVLQRAGLGIDDLDAYEVNEAFAPVPLAWAHDTGADPARLNPRGGRSPSATRSARPAPGCSPRSCTTCRRPAAGTGCRRCARAGAWRTARSWSDCDRARGRAGAGGDAAALQRRVPRDRRGAARLRARGARHRLRAGGVQLRRSEPARLSRRAHGTAGDRVREPATLHPHAHAHGDDGSRARPRLRRALHPRHRRQRPAGGRGLPRRAVDAPLARTREVVNICRQVWRREKVQHQGKHYQIPLPADRGTGLGKPLRLINTPFRERIPVMLAAIRPKNVALAAEIAEGWEPIFFHPEKAGDVWSPALREGAARRDPALGPLDIVVGLRLAIGDDVEKLLQLGRPQLALYIGGMGARDRNFYNDLARRYGYKRQAELIQDLYLDGKKDEAAGAVPEGCCGPRRWSGRWGRCASGSRRSGRRARPRSTSTPSHPGWSGGWPTSRPSRSCCSDGSPA